MEELMMERLKNAERLVRIDKARCLEIDSDIAEVNEAIKELNAYYKRRSTELICTQKLLKESKERSIMALENDTRELENLRHLAAASQ